MSTALLTDSINFEPHDNKRLANLCGQHNSHIQQLERFFKVRILNRGNWFNIHGEQADAVTSTKDLLLTLYQDTLNPGFLTVETIKRYLKQYEVRMKTNLATNPNDLNLKTTTIKPRSTNQNNLINNVQKYDINFAIGPAGTGKTFLAIACAVSALEQGHVDRIILARPAVEAGENLGFLPGDLSQKVDPYLRPLFDALYELLGTIKANRLIESKIIEIAPLAYMRGRTLNDAFVIMDEGQNTTIKQMKMFLTRLGFNSKAVITGDITQVDLPNGKPSGLIHCIDVLEGVDDIGFNYFNTGDVVRHPLVQKIVDAYDKDEAESRHDHR